MEFIETEPFNTKFELVGLETKNFLLNSGSFTIWIFIFVFNWTMRKIWKMNEKRVVSCKHGRRIGLRLNKVSSSLFANIVRLFFEYYFEIVQCISISIYDLCASERKFADNFATFGSSFNTVVLFIVIIAAVTFPIWTLVTLRKNQEKLDTDEIRKKYEFLYEDLDASSYGTATFHM